MSHLVSSHRQVLRNICNFEHELENSADLQERLAYARAWYAYKNTMDEWCFGPSKFVGYEGMTAGEYISHAHENNGRRTEKQLAQWFDIVPNGSELHEELETELNLFLAKYGKEPSTLTRFNVLKTEKNDNVKDAETPLVDLLVAVAKTLSRSDQSLLLGRLQS